jgi:hypothetical protein
MELVPMDGKIHKIKMQDEGFYGSIVKLKKPIVFSNTDEYFQEEIDKLVDKYFLFLRQNFNPFGFNENFTIVFRPPCELDKDTDAPHGTLAIKFKFTLPGMPCLNEFPLENYLAKQKPTQQNTTP